MLHFWGKIREKEFCGMLQIRTLFSLVVLLALLSSPEYSLAVAKKDSLTIGSIGSPSLFNPYFSADAVSGQVESLLYNGLVSYDEHLNPIPELASRWDVSTDGYNWTFHLKKGVQFHDGEELTAKDVVFSYSIPRTKGYAGPRGSDFDKIKRIREIDRYTVQFTLTEPYAPFLNTCSYAILPEHILGQVPIEKLAEHPFNTKQPIGTGPFRFDKWKDGQYVKLTANHQFFKGSPHLESIYFRIVPDQNAQLIQLQSGGIDITNIPATDLAVGKMFEEQGKVRLSSQPTLAYTYIGYNLKNPLFQDEKVRQALTYALDRQLIVDVVLQGQGQVAHTHGSPLHWAYGEQIKKYTYNPELAKKLLAEAGWKDTDGDGILDKNGQKLSFTLMTNQGNKIREMVSQIVQEQWSKIGVEAKPRLMEWSAFINDYVNTKKFEAVILGWSLGVDPDPTAMWHSKEAKSGLNFISYQNAEVDKLLEENTQVMDKEKRKQLLLHIQKIIAEQQPYTFLYYANEITAYPPNLQGISNHPTTFFHNPHMWYLP
jgi:peptide/nickel transport system substrate-binding protein